ncbi:MAG: LPS export ABC transporter periplasmic protein LptC [Chitinispirillia bacterium]|nr:LPS export ABC transporter periplasmic protein LptC [Chitinispirillia bacterium]
MITIRIAAYFMIFALISGCAPPKDTIPVASDAISAPHQALTDASLVFYEHGLKRWQLDTDYMNRPLADTGTMFAYPVKIIVYDSVGNLSARIISDSGSSDAKMEIFNLWSNVYIRNEDGMVVKSEQLKWYKNSRLITSDTFVQVETPKGDILKGKGLNAKDDFSRFSFSSDVQGRFPDFRRRVEEDDADFLK